MAERLATTPRLDSPRRRTSAKFVSDQLLPRAKTFVSHPHFYRARNIYSEMIYKLHEGAGITRYLVNETARALISNICIYVDSYFDIDDTRSGLTIRKIQNICAQRGVASRGRVFAFVKMLEISGYLERSPVADKRLKLLRPTAKLRNYRRELMAGIYAAIDEIMPDGGYARLGADPDVDVKIVRIAGHDYFSGVLLLEWHRDILLFADRDGGYKFLLELLISAKFLDESQEFDENIDISLLKLSIQLGLSRSHLRKILTDAATLGLVALDNSRRYKITLNSRLTDAFDEHVALLLVYYADIIDNRLDESHLDPFQSPRRR